MSNGNTAHRRAAPRRRAAEQAGAAAPSLADFEEAMRQLEEAAEALEDGRLPLDESVEVFERGMRLARQCQDILDQAALRVRQLVAEDDSGELAVETFELDVE